MYGVLKENAKSFALDTFTMFDADTCSTARKFPACPCVERTCTATTGALAGKPATWYADGSQARMQSGGAAWCFIDEECAAKLAVTVQVQTSDSCAGKPYAFIGEAAARAKFTGCQAGLGVTMDAGP